MPRIRYKKHPDEERNSSSFNIHAMSEILTGDDSAFISDLDVFIEALGEWKDMRQAFKDKDIIPSNLNDRFMEPQNDEQRQKGWY